MVEDVPQPGGDRQERDQHAEIHRQGPFRWYAQRRASARSRRSVDLVWRLVVGLIGALVVVAGVAMLALPGPGWGTIILGLAILSTEFAWARRLRQRVMARLHEFSERHPTGISVPWWGWVGMAVLALAAVVAFEMLIGFPDWATSWWPA